MTIWNTITRAILVFGSLATTLALAETQKSNEPGRTATANTGALASHRYRVLVSTDIGGTDPDVFQYIVTHYPTRLEEDARNHEEKLYEEFSFLVCPDHHLPYPTLSGICTDGS